MKLTSIKHLLTEAANVAKRFPLELIFATAGCIAATVIVEFENNEMEVTARCWRIVMASNIGLLTSLSASLLIKAKSIAGRGRVIFYLFSVLIAVLFFFLLHPLEQERDIPRFFMISFALHLLVAYIAFAGPRGSINAFWQFNRILFLRFLAGALYSVVLYAGLSAALGALNFLFNCDFRWDSFAILFVWIAGLFQTVFFLSGVPADLEQLENDTSYPKGLKLFTQYVLIPLATVYVLILLSYEIKILAEWNLPKGLVSSLILGYAVFGILSFLLMYPLRNLDGNKWISTYNRLFYYLLIPLLVLLFVSIYVRIDKYGITEGRYFLIILALWLTGITIYFLLSRKQSILVVPLTLSVVTIAGAYGPLSAFNIAERSQLEQLKSVFEKNKLLQDGKLKPVSAKLDSASNDRIIELSRYMIKKYGLESLQPIIKEDLTAVTDSIKISLNKGQKGRSRFRKYTSWDLANAERNWLDKNYKLPVDYYLSDKLSHTVVAQNSDLIPLKNADYLLEVSSFYHSDDQDSMKLDGAVLKYRFTDSILHVRIGRDSIARSLRPVMDRIEREVKNWKPSDDELANGATALSREILRDSFLLGAYNVEFLINRIIYESRSEKVDGIENIEGVLLLRKK